MDDKSMLLEIRDYKCEFQDKFLTILSFLLFGFGLIMIIIENEDSKIGSYSTLVGVAVLIMNYLFIYFLRQPLIKGRIILGFDSIDFIGTIIKTEDIEYFGLRYLDYRGKIGFSKYEYPLPRLGINNEIKLKTKSGLFFETKFYVARKTDRKKIDRFIQHWINNGIRIDYLIEDELIMKTK